jgi:REP element-mobilizing transposase RayT
MTSARAFKIDLNATPFYHCVSRCVRRSFLCGFDKETGIDFSHRKEWIINRIKFLASIFAIKICAYAVMSNHYHLVLFIDQKAALNWSDEEVINRWAALFPRNAAEIQYLELTSKQAQQKISLWREHLMSISWFMRCMNETIARWSNQEDDCTGRFWEGRFKSQALLDEGAVLAAMAYVDLNPIRASIAQTPEESEFTSIFERIRAASQSLKHLSKKEKSIEQVIKICDNAAQPFNLMLFKNAKKNDESIAQINFKLSDYLQLVDTTGRILREGKKGIIPSSLTPILFRLQLTSKGWMEMVKSLEDKFFTAIGNESSLKTFGADYRKRPPKGLSSARLCYQTAA